MREIILASQSPRRKELLTKMGVEFATIPSTYDEHLDDSRDVESVAIELSVGKAENVAASHPDAFVIGSDTIVGIDGRQLGKAGGIDEARVMLRSLAGKVSTVTTGLAIVCVDENIKMTDVDTVKVWFKPESDEVTKLREEYLASGDWKDKAGAYGVQTVYGILVEKVEGDLATVVGLPTLPLAKMLNDLGFESACTVAIQHSDIQ